MILISFWAAVYNIWICLHSIVLCVGEIPEGSWDQEHVKEGPCQTSSGDPNLVPCNHIPVLWPHQLNCWISSCQLYCLYNPCFSSHGHFCFSTSSRGRSFWFMDQYSIYLTYYVIRRLICIKYIQIQLYLIISTYIDSLTT